MKSSTAHPARWWHRDGDRFACTLCPRACVLSPGQRGFCFVRQATGTGIALTSYGRSTGLCVDPVEKKPLYHFYPGSAVLSLGTAGCNLGCKYCQNWEISKSRDDEILSEAASPRAVALMALGLGARSVAFTYNDPVIFAEYAIDTAAACHDHGVQTIAVTAGYVAPPARAEFFDAMDAANIDLKAFSEAYYQHQCLGHLQPVLDTIEEVARAGRCWLELTTLVIPGLNDGDRELHAMCAWLVDHVGVDVPLHFTAFHPNHKLRSVPPTPPATLRRARDIAHAHGLRWVYLGNVADRVGSTTACPECDAPLIEREGHAITRFALRDGRCPYCSWDVPGRFAASAEHWGTRRLAVAIPGEGPPRVAPPDLHEEG
ncbi:MAG: AmmeMemoRadiSam system radical SAM enzyme [Deltaproteobacteria bacterium]|nr:AmmeMemoRadiSam system radical SAM enzyme [Deltaproteobacteria bacterium]